MARQSEFAAFLDLAQRKIDALTRTGRGNHARRRPLLRELLEWSVLRKEPEHVGAVLRVSGRLRELEARRDRVACAVHGTVRHGISLARSATLAGVAPSDLQSITLLARRAEIDLARLDRNADDLVRGAVDRYLERLVITLDQRAIEDLLLAALEAYAVPRPGRGQRYTEAYGYCFGTPEPVNENETARSRIYCSASSLGAAKATRTEPTPASASRRCAPPPLRSGPTGDPEAVAG